jgi:phosphinothricin acetyltransferase
MPTMSDEITLRDAVPGDAEGICAIYNAALAERVATFETKPRVASDFRSRIDEMRFPLVVAEVSAGIAGWAALAPYSERPCYSGIGEASVYVAPESRNNGVGTAITEALADEAAGRGFHKLIGKLFTGNAASLRLCARCGFRKVGIHERHGQLDGEWRDVLVVERLLDAQA